MRTIRREILEEVGIDTNDAKIGLADDKGSGETEKTLKDTGEVVLCKMRFNVYRVDIDKNAGDIKTSLDDDLAKIAWVDPNELSSYKLTPLRLRFYAIRLFVIIVQGSTKSLLFGVVATYNMPSERHARISKYPALLHNI